MFFCSSLAEALLFVALSHGAICHHKVVPNQSVHSSHLETKSQSAVREKQNTFKLEPDSVRHVQIIRIQEDQDYNVNSSNWGVGYVAY